MQQTGSAQWHLYETQTLKQQEANKQEEQQPDGSEEGEGKTNKKQYQVLGVYCWLQRYVSDMNAWHTVIRDDRDPHLNAALNS